MAQFIVVTGIDKEPFAVNVDQIITFHPSKPGCVITLCELDLHVLETFDEVLDFIQQPHE